MKSPIQNIVVFDLETTGLKAQENCLVEIACCPIDNELKDLKPYYSEIMRVYDNRRIDQPALIANGISREQIEKGRDPKEVIEELCKYLESQRVGKALPILAGHNIIDFDIPFFSDYFGVFKKDLSKYVNLKYSIDTMWEARKMWPESVNYKLHTCCELAGVELVNAHRAVADTMANRELVKFFLRNMRTVNGEKSKENRFRTTFKF